MMTMTSDADDRTMRAHPVGGLWRIFGSPVIVAKKKPTKKMRDGKWFIVHEKVAAL